MQFLFPAFLFALATLAIPIIIHLFYFRRFKRVYFTNVRFLKEVKEESSNRQKLRNLMVLLMRCLAILFLVLAFAQPFLPKSDSVKRGDQAVSIYIDNSFSMEALAKDAPLLELSKQRARDIVQAYAVSDRFQILTNDFEGRDQRLISQEDALNRIEEIGISPATKDLSKVVVRQKQCLSTGKADNQIAYVLSDFQKSTSDLEQIQDTLTEIQLVPMRAVQENNISIDSAWFESPVQILNQPARLLVQLSNRGDEDAEEVRLSFTHDQQTKPVGSVQIPPRATRMDTVSFTILHPGWHEAKLSISDYPVHFDDDYFINFYVAEQVQVLAINNGGSNQHITKAFTGARYFRCDQAEANALDYSKFGDYQLIILNELPSISSGLGQELKRFADNGGNVMVFPAANADLNAYAGMMQSFNAPALGGFDATARQASQINTQEFVFQDVFLNKSANLRLPGTTGNYLIPTGTGEPILTYRDGSILLMKYAAGEGAMYLYAAPLNEQAGDLVKNGEIFVPMLFKMAVAGSKSGPLAYIIGKDEVLEAPHLVSATGETIYKLKLRESTNASGKASQQEFIPEQRILGQKVLLNPGKQIDGSGWYALQLNQDSLLAEFAFNFDRKESDLHYFSDEELSEKLQPNMRLLSENAEANFTQVVDEQNQGIVLWRWCLIFALLFLALETLFLRLWKV
jgi:hypothetical protein